MSTKKFTVLHNLSYIIFVFLLLFPNMSHGTVTWPLKATKARRLLPLKRTKKKWEMSTFPHQHHPARSNKGSPISSSRCTSFLYFPDPPIFFQRPGASETNYLSIRWSTQTVGNSLAGAIANDANALAAAHNHKMREKRNLMMMAPGGWLYGFR